MVTENSDGSFTFKIYYPHAGLVEVVGDFTRGTGGLAMRRDPEGWWSVRARLPAGDRTFRYVVNGQLAIPDYAAGGLARDADGSWTSCLHAPASSERGPAAEAAVAAPAEVAITESELRLLRAGERIEIPVGEGGGRVLLSFTRARRPGPGRTKTATRPERGAERRRAARDERRGAATPLS